MKQLALIYCRVSGERQKKEGHGLDSQEHRCVDCAIERDCIVDRIFPDTASGGGDFLNRPAMRELLAYVDSKPHIKFTVIFDDLKRFARDVEFHIKLRAAFRSRGITPVCLNYNFDDSPEGTFVETIFAAQNQLEREQNRRQVIQKQRARLEMGFWPFHHFPGYRSKIVEGKGKVLQPHEPEASIIKEGLEGFASGRFQLQADLQRFLHEKGYLSSVDNKKKYTYPAAVKRILDRVVLYAGYAEYLPWEVARRQGQHEALITDEVMRKIEQKMKGSIKHKVMLDIHPDFHARGIVCCPECLRPMTASWSIKKRKNYKMGYYRCNTIECEYRNKGVEKSVMEKQIVTALKKVQPKKQIVDLSKAILLDAWSKREELAERKKKATTASLQEIQARKSDLLDRIVKSKSEYVIEAYEKEMEKLAIKEGDLINDTSNNNLAGKDFETALNSVSQFLESPYEYWSNGGVNEKRLALKLVFSGNLVYDHKKGFETDNLCCVLKVFEQIAISKYHDVEMGVSKPRLTTVNI